MKIILNHDISIPIKQPVFHGFRIRLAFCFNRGSKKIHGSRQDSWLFGYGFSYVYRRCAALAKPFPHCHFGEELDDFGDDVDGHSSEQSPKYYNGNSQEKPQI